MAYLNTGTCGPLPDVAAEAMQQSLGRQLENGRTGVGYYTQLKEAKQKVREQLAMLLSVKESSLALTENTTHGLNIVLWGLPLNPGDEVIVTDTEHQGALLPVFAQKQRRGAVIKLVDGTLAPDLLLSAIEQEMTPRTRLVVVSHVSFETGARLPIERIADLAHAHGASIAVDGAQGAGAEAFNLGSTSIDFYAFPGQKWLCGPDGTGALYVRPQAMPILDPTYLGFPSLADAEAYNFSGSYLSRPDAGRYEHAFTALVNWIGFARSLEFMRVSVGWDYAFTRIHGLSGELINALLNFDHVRLLTPRDQRVGLVSFQLRHQDPKEFVREAQARSIDIRVIAHRSAVRVSTGFYNTEDEIARFVQLVENAK